MTPEKLAAKYRALIKERMPKIETAHDDKSHFYVYNGQKYPSVTAKLQLLKDEGLANWKMNRALEFVLKSYPWTGYTNMEQVIEQAKLAPVKEFEGAGSIGSAVHAWREASFRMLINNEDGYKAEISDEKWKDPAVISGCRAIQKFMADTGYIPVACELYLADPDLKIGGTLDDIGVMNGKLCLVDLKTSNIGDKTAYFLQVALYYHMFKKLTGISIKEFYILHVSKADGTYKLIPIKNMTQLIRDAKTLLKLKASLDRIGEEKKKQPIVI